MYTPSEESEAIRARLQSAAPLDFRQVPDGSAPRVYIRIGEYTVSLQISDATLREAFEQRFELSGPGTGTAVLGMSVADYQTDVTDLVLSSPFRTVVAKRKGMVYYGVQDKQTLGVLAGSVGLSGGDMNPRSSTAETDFMLCLIEAEIMTALGRMAPQIDFAHAACISRNGRAVLLLGPSGSGKTTLSAAANVRGFELLGDDVSCIDLGRLAAYSYPRKPRLRAESEKMLTRLGGESLPTVTPGRQQTIAAVCLLCDFVPEPVLCPLSGTNALWRISRNFFHVGRPAASIITRLAQRLPEIPCYELLPGSLNDTVPVLERLTESSASAV